MLSLTMVSSFYDIWCPSPNPSPHSMWPRAKGCQGPVQVWAVRLRLRLWQPNGQPGICTDPGLCHVSRKSVAGEHACSALQTDWTFSMVCGNPGYRNSECVQVCETLAKPTTLHITTFSRRERQTAAFHHFFLIFSLEWHSLHFFGWFQTKRHLKAEGIGFH